MLRATFRFACALVVLLAWASTLASAQVVAGEELLGEKGPENDPDDRYDTVSPDGRRVAWREKRGKAWTVMVNGEGGDTFDGVDTLVFSPDSRRFAYRAQGAGKWAMVVDGKATMRVIGKGTIQGVAYEELGPARFSAEGGRVAYWAKMKRKAMVLVDGAPGTEYDDVGDPAFSPDGQHVLYPAKPKKKWVVVVDGEEQPPEMKAIWNGDLVVNDVPVVAGLPWAQFHDALGPMWVGRVDKGWSLVVEGKPGPAFGALSWPIFFGSEGSRFAYAGAEIDIGFGGSGKGIGQIIVDGEPGPSYEGKSTKSFGMALLDTAGRVSVGYGIYETALHGVATARMFAGVDDLTRYGLLPGVFEDLGVHRYGVSSPQVSPDGERVAYAARRDEEDYVVMLDGKAGPSFDSITCGPRFTTDGSLVYVGVEEGELILLRNGERSSAFPWKDAECATMRVVEGDHVVYVANRDDRWRVFVDGTAGEEYRARSVAVVTHLLDDELHVAYAVRSKDDEADSFVVLDGRVGKRYDGLLTVSLELSDDGLAYVARQGRKFFRVSRALP